MATFDINEVARRAQYTSTGQAGPYAFNFQVNAASELQVYKNDALQTDSVNYNATLNADGTGSITFIDNSGIGGDDYTPANGDLITIIGDQPLSRTTVFQVGQANNPVTLETEFDNVVIRQQQIKEITDRALQLKPSTPRTVTGSGTSGPIYWPYDATPANNASRVISYDSNGTGLELGPTTANLNTLASITSDISTVAGISSEIQTVAADETDIGVVATNINSVNTVATNINDVIKVADDLNEAVSEVETVANDLNEAVSEIDTVGTNIGVIQTVGDSTNIANITTVAGEISPTNNISTLANISADITTLANTSGLTTLANNAADISTVAGIQADVTAVANIDAAVSAVNSNSANINAVNANSTNINTVATDLSGSNTIGTVAADLSGSNNIGTVASNLSNVNNFAETYRISASQPTTSLDIGDLWFDTANSVMKVYSSSGWITAASAVNGTAARFKYTATASQTTFTGADDNTNTLAYDSGFMDVYLNGVKLVSGASNDYVATNGTSIILNSGAAANDILEAIAYGTFELTNFSINDANDVQTTGLATNDLLRYDGTNFVPKSFDEITPTQTSNAGKFLTTDGTNSSWGTVNTNLVADTTPQLGGDLDGNGNTIDLTGNTESFGLPRGTTAQEPTASTAEGHIRYNNDDDTVYFSNGSNWLKIASAVPTLTNVTGTIYETLQATLTLTGTNFLNNNLVVTFTRSGTDYTQTVTPTSDTSASVTTPSGLNSVTASGDVISIKVTNSDFASSNTQTVTVFGLPSGGSISNNGNYRVHAFTSSGTLTVPSSFSTSSYYLVTAGGGGAGNSYFNATRGGGGGGAGGVIYNTSYTLATGSYTITIGAGGSGGANENLGSDGSNTTAFSQTAIGGGGGAIFSNTAGTGFDGRPGGSGGGGRGSGTVGGAGTTGQGNAGGQGGDQTGGGGGGGGKSQTGFDTHQVAGDVPSAHDGGDGTDYSSIFGTSLGESGYFGGGGAGSSGEDTGMTNNLTGAAGGLGGGGNSEGVNGGTFENGDANTGGGGGAGHGSTSSGSGGSGIVLIAYDTTAL